MSAQLGTISCIPCPDDTAGETLVSYLAKTREIAKVIVDLNSTEDQAISIAGASRWIVHRVMMVSPSVPISNAVGGVYVGQNKTGELLVPATQVYELPDTESYQDLGVSEYSDTHIFSDPVLYFSLTTPEGSAATAELHIIYEDLDPATVTVNSNECVKVYNIPGNKGDEGDPGTDGTDGSNAYTATTQSLTQPAADGNVSVTVGDAAWMGIGQIIFLVGGGYYEVMQVVSNTVTLKNLAYIGNAGVATIIGTGAKISPAGPEGTITSITTTLDDIAPAGTAGTLIVHNGTDYVAFDAVLNNYRLPRIDTTVAKKITWDFINLSTWTLNGQLPVASGGTGAANIAAARANLSAAVSGANGDITSLTALTSIKVGTSGATITAIYSATATLDFPNTSSNASSDLTMTVTGAVVGDTVMLGLPASPAVGSFSGWVSATNTVTVRYHNSSGGSSDPASATYRATVFHI